MIKFLTDPERRRSLRAIIQTILALALIGLLYWITGKVTAASSVLMAIARGALIILGLGEVFYGAENVTRAIKLTGPAGTSLQFGEDATPVRVVNQPDEAVPVDTQPPAKE